MKFRSSLSRLARFRHPRRYRMHTTPERAGHGMASPSRSMLGKQVSKDLKQRTPRRAGRSAARLLGAASKPSSQYRAKRHTCLLRVLRASASSVLKSCLPSDGPRRTAPPEQIGPRHPTPGERRYQTPAGLHPRITPSARDARALSIAGDGDRCLLRTRSLR